MPPWNFGRHCEPTGRREAPPDDRLREAIQSHKGRLDCFAEPVIWRVFARPLARNDGVNNAAAAEDMDSGFGALRRPGMTTES